MDDNNPILGLHGMQVISMDAMLQMLMGGMQTTLGDIESYNMGNSPLDIMGLLNSNNKIVEIVTESENLSDVVRNSESSDSDIEALQSEDDDEYEHIEPIILKREEKVLINVGGKKFRLAPSVLKKLDIRVERLSRVKSEYFMDRDGYYFQEIIQLLNNINGNKDLLLDMIGDFSDQMIVEMVAYQLLPSKFKPEYKTKLKNLVGFKTASNGKPELVRIYVQNKKFETFDSTISRSEYLTPFLKSQSVIKLDTDPTLFRYVLNFLRHGELYVMNKQIIALMNTLQIPYELLEKSHDYTIMTAYEPLSSETSMYQLSMNNNQLNYKYYPKPASSALTDVADNYFIFNESNRYLNYDNMDASFNNEYMNVIQTKSKLAFSSTLDFDLTCMVQGDLIEDIMVVIDLPILNPVNNLRYVDNVGYNLIEDIKLTIMNNNLMESNGDYLYLYPIVYGDQAQSYHTMANVRTACKSKIIYDSHLIDVTRLVIPLNLIRNATNHLPIQKFIKNNWSCHLLLTLSSSEKVLKSISVRAPGKPTEVPILNVFLQANYANLGLNMSSPTKKITINNELRNDKLMYIYDHTKCIRAPITPSDDKYFNVTMIPLIEFFHMKDLIITINDSKSNDVGCYVDALIELEILVLMPNNELQVYQKFDSMFLNEVIPLKRLKRTLPPGIYYYSFSSDPYDHRILGGMPGKNVFVRIKTTNISGTINVFSNNYQKAII
jgi:hypothetical protein